MTTVRWKLQWLMGLACTFSFCLMLAILHETNPQAPLSREKCERAEALMKATETQQPPDAPVDSHAIRDKREVVNASGKSDLIDKPNEKPKHTMHKPVSLLSSSNNVSLAFKQYIKLRPERVDPTRLEFLISAENICSGKHPVFLLILSVSEYFDVEKRNIIRQTWGSVAKTDRWPLVKGTFQVKHVFVLSNPGTSAVKRAIMKEESDTFRDIVLVNVEESLQTQSKRLMAGLKWVSQHCSRAKFVLKADAKTMVHIPNLVDYLKPFKIEKRGLVIGSVQPHTKVLRGGMWAMNQSVYPFDLYPPYASGAAYVISGNIIETMYTAAEHLTYLFVEDVFISGVVRLAMGAELKNNREFASKFNRSPGLCDLHRKGRISVTNVIPRIQLQIWEALHHANCTEEEKI